MPRGDRTGPAGMGPMTGRAAGYCAGYSTPGYMNPYGGRYSYNAPAGGWRPHPTYGPFPGRASGFGFGRGRGGYGRGRGRW